ncbi:hypothetical protein EJ04DRAFT_569258 [Polyplosphaeria fusca]|uniref:Uncharacterized protein n=1 Tax=Polyplosphaeria fusca TaxID=682080 RepID=A0A9P4QN94_9PLEO|nr:hypothetical protein EJ04DRAFT_569258 [Polyplosphaeria fusca]
MAYASPQYNPNAYQPGPPQPAYVQPGQAGYIYDQGYTRPQQMTTEPVPPPAGNPAFEYHAGEEALKKMNKEKKKKKKKKKDKSDGLLLGIRKLDSIKEYGGSSALFNYND